MPEDSRNSKLAAFRERDFSLFLPMRFMTVLASQMIDVSVAWLIYDITGSAIALGFIGLCSFLPNILFLLVAATLAGCAGPFRPQRPAWRAQAENAAGNARIARGRST